MGKKKNRRRQQPVKSRKPLVLSREIQARYDAAQTTSDNSRHWLNADQLSANAATCPDVRRTLRMRSRYEIANNSYAKGMISTLASDCIGTGPRLQVLTDDPIINGMIELEFTAWARAAGITKKLTTMRKAKVGDGEAFGVMVNNPKIASNVQLDLRLIEADQVATPGHLISLQRPDLVDGIKLDRYGNPEYYHVLKNHPGEPLGVDMDYDTIPAASMLHWFNVDRPGQYRGIPEITPSIPLFSQLRRYTLAVLGAAETVADFAAVVYTNSPAQGESAEVQGMDVIELEKRMATVLPEGWELGQIKPEQPNSTYAEFKKELLNEIARCLCMPYNVAACNSAGYNYASGRLDHQGYHKVIKIEQNDLAGTILDVIFRAWLKEARLVVPALRKFTGNYIVPHTWFWDGFEHVDPQKVANANHQELEDNTTTLSDIYGAKGQDWEQKLRQRAKEKDLQKELGLTDKEAAA